MKTKTCNLKRQPLFHPRSLLFHKLKLLPSNRPRARPKQMQKLIAKQRAKVRTKLNRKLKIRRRSRIYFIESTASWLNLRAKISQRAVKVKNNRIMMIPKLQKKLTQ